MIELSTHIEYLLLEHDEVAVPHLGVFHAVDVPARRIEEEGIFLPPCRTITFRQEDSNGGETFIRSLAKLYSLPLHEATISCASYNEEIRQTLSEDGTANVGSIGYFVQEEGSERIDFVPFQSGVCTPMLYGLDTIAMPRLTPELRAEHEKQQQEQRVKVGRVRRDNRNITIHINRRLFNYAAAVAASVVLYFAYSTPKPAATPATMQPQQAEMFLPTVGLSSVAESVMAKVKAAEEAAMPEPAVAEPAMVEDGYFIVLMSAVPDASARQYAADLQQRGYDAHACYCNGMVRVIIPGFDSEEAARTKIREMRSVDEEFSKIWPCPVRKPFTLSLPE